MKLLLVLVGLVAAGHSMATEERFQQFKSRYGKVYQSEVEETLRFSIFQSNLREAEVHNAGGSTYRRGVNKWSDLTREEWEEMYLGGYKHIAIPSRPAKASNIELLKDLPAHIDWREEGVISDVKNQGRCGSCWAFGTTEQIESYAALSSNNLVELSAQQVTSCTPNPLTCGGTGGCAGSTPPLGYNYVQLFGQVMEEEYPYVSGTTSNDEDCQYDLASIQPAVTISGYNNLPPNNQAAVMNHIATVGPLAISVAASTFKDYEGGVFTGCDYEGNVQLNHAVQLVGYGSDFSPMGVVDYWLVRNSWGADWGEEGYIRLLREAEPRCGVDSNTSGHVCEGGPGNDLLNVCGMCGMLFETSYPLGVQAAAARDHN